MADLFKALKPEAHLSKNGFDMSQKHVFSSIPGLITPVACIETVPGDYHEIDLAGLVRTQTMNTAAFLRGKFRYDFFFVPYVQLWHPFNQFITQRTDKHTTLQKDKNFCPVIQLSDLLQMILDEYRATADGSKHSDIHGFRWHLGAVRLLDQLGYGNHTCLFELEGDNATQYIARFAGKYVNIFRAAAYQHIFYDYYRNKYYDDNGASDGTASLITDFVSTFNFDDLECSTLATSVLPTSDSRTMARVRALFMPHYSQWKKDLFTSSLPSTQFGAVAAVPLGGDSLVTLSTDYPHYGSGSSFDTSTTHFQFGFEQGTLENNSSGLVTVNNRAVSVRTPHWHEVQSSSSSLSLNVLDLRKYEVLQNWKDATLRAGNMTGSQWKAHFGVQPYYDADENVNFLGSFEAPLQVNPVETTAQSDGSGNSRVGDIGATGTAVVRGQKIKFDAKDFGVIMCLSTFVPESEYNSTMIDKANRLFEQFDFFTPEFQNIGLEAIERVDFDAVNGGMNTVLGYVPRYAMYKQAVDKVHGEFGNFTYEGVSNSYIKFKGSFSPWVAPRVDVFGQGEVSSLGRHISSFYVDPAVYNNVMAITIDGSYDTDTFLHNVYLDVKSIRPMSVLGIPQF